MNATRAPAASRVERLMALRNRLAVGVGLKHLGGLAMIDPHKRSADYRPGERVGITRNSGLPGGNRTPDPQLRRPEKRHFRAFSSINVAP